ncbi:MAG: HEAT repeat domain-containing protein [Planctomycetes bacterium]|nr:HEAT repeat domain-containing protein [Planctomycetota bacterium]
MEAMVEGYWKRGVCALVVIVGLSSAVLAAPATSGADAGQTAAGPDWIVKLADADPAVRDAAPKSAREKGAAGIPDLVAALKSDSALRRFWATRLLGELRANEAVTPLSELLRTETAEFVLREAAGALGAIGEKSALVGLRDLSKTKPIAAAPGLAALGDQSSIVPLVRALITAVQPRDRVALGAALCRLGCRAGIEPLVQVANIQGNAGSREALATLNEVLSEPPPTTFTEKDKNLSGWWASHGDAIRLKNEIEKAGPELDSAMQDFLKAIWSDDDESKRDAQRVLAKLEGIAIPYLMRELGGPNSERAAEVLSRMGTAGRSPLVAAIASPDAALRREAISILSESKAFEAGPALLEMLKTQTSPEDLELAFKALTILAPKDLAPILKEKATSPDRSQHAAAARALGRMKDDESVALIDQMSKALDGASGTEKVAVGGALLRGDKTAGVPILIDCLSDPDIAVRREADMTLVVGVGRYYGFDAESAESDRAAAVARWRDFWDKQKDTVTIDSNALRNADQFAVPVGSNKQILKDAIHDLGDPAIEKRAKAEEMLSQSNRLYGCPALLSALPELTGAARISAASILAGRVDRQLIPALRKLLKDASPVVRRLAAGGLGAFDSKLYEDEAAVLLPDLKAAFASEKEPHAKIAIAYALGRLGDPSGIPTLVEYMKVVRSAEYPKAAWVRDEAFMALRDLTSEATGGKDFGYEANASATARDAAIQAWEKWWGEKGKDFTPRKRFLKPKPAVDKPITPPAGKSGQ